MQMTSGDTEVTENAVMGSCHAEYEDPCRAIAEIADSDASAAYLTEVLEIPAGILEPTEEDVVPAPAASSRSGSASAL
eukprot:12407949-Karenia_brevis.AAC.1